MKMRWPLAGVAGFWAVCVLAGDYYVKIGGIDQPAGGRNWADAWGSIDYALERLRLTGETNATVWVGFTQTGQSYGLVAESFTNNIILRILGGIEMGTQTPVGRSAIRGTGAAGISLGVADPGAASGRTNSAQFVLCNFDVDTNHRAFQNPVSFQRRRMMCWYTISNCVFRSSSTTEPLVYFLVSDYGLAPEEVTFYRSSLMTTSTSSRAAFYVDYSASANGRNQVTMVRFLDGCEVVAAADGGGGVATRLAAVVHGWSHIVVRDSSITNRGTGWCVYGGRLSYGGYNHTNHFVRSTFNSNGGGFYLLNNDPSPSGVPNRFENIRLTAVGPHGIYLYGHHGADNQWHWLVSNCVVKVTGDGAVGLYIGRNNGGVLRAVVSDSIIHGTGRACVFYPGGGGNAGNDEVEIRRCVLSAGSNDGLLNSTNEVALFDSYKGVTVRMYETLVKNGRGGINLDPGQYAYFTMVNSAVTDQSIYGVRLDSGGNYGERLHATNCTFSALGNTAVVFGDNGTSAVLAGTFRYCAFAPGTNATVFVNEDADRNLLLDGLTNAFYRYGTFSSGLVQSNLQGNDNRPAENPRFATDGYHLDYSSPLMDRYTLQARDPVTDIDGHSRPHKLYGDIGCDEAVLPPRGIVLTVR
ncbi:MAG: hypothetical protein N2255_02415 [Kiritimatiellae bacterium]|nr:hypothetical protein [Kiritimatiellia bacterium]